MKANRKFKDEEEAVSAVIGVILMVAITVAIAATVYVYVSGMMGGGVQSTPSISMTAEPAADDTSVLVTIGTVTDTGIAWTDVSGTLANVTSGTEMTIADLTWRPTGTISGGDIIQLSNAVDLVANPLQGGSKYRFTLSYDVTGGSMGTVTWNQ